MSELRKMTRMGGDLRKIARLLQDKGRNGDTILAHINPREAALLREQGGAGTINPDTGLPEFSDWSEGSSGYDVAPTESDYLFEEPPRNDFYGTIGPYNQFNPNAIDLTAQPQQQAFEANYLPESTFQDTVGYDLGPASFNTQRGASAFDTGFARGAIPEPTPSQFALTRPEFSPSLAGPAPAAQPAEKGFLESLTGGDKARLGLGALGGLQTALTARKARQGAQDAARRISEIGRPYQQQGLAQQSAASRGELTPVNQQALDAMRARASQAGVARGGVGVAQQQRAEEDLRQRLLAAQQDFGLKLSGIGDQYTAKAIQDGIRADADIANLYGNYFSNLTRLAAPTIIQSAQPAGK
jgi:hypothetical protein